MSLTAVLRCMQFDDITVHGSRSSFRDWRAEAAANTFSREVCEHALAHRLPDRKPLRWRDDLFDRCGLLMQTRTCFCASATPTVAQWDVCTGHPYARCRLVRVLKPFAVTVFMDVACIATGTGSRAATHACIHCKISLLSQADERPLSFTGAGKVPSLMPS